MFKPHNGYVLCRLLQKQHDDVVEQGIAYSKQFFPIYEVMDVSELSIGLELSKNDKILTNSIPTKIVDKGQKLYLISQDHIAAKIIK